MMPTEAESLMSSALRRDFLPATGLGGHAPLAAQAQHARNGASNAENQENAADELHGLRLGPEYRGKHFRGWAILAYFSHLQVQI